MGIRFVLPNIIRLKHNARHISSMSCRDINRHKTSPARLQSMRKFWELIRHHSPVRSFILSSLFKNRGRNYPPRLVRRRQHIVTRLIGNARNNCECFTPFVDTTNAKCANETFPNAEGPKPTVHRRTITTQEPSVVRWRAAAKQTLQEPSWTSSDRDGTDNTLLRITTRRRSYVTRAKEVWPSAPKSSTWQHRPAVVEEITARFLAGRLASLFVGSAVAEAGIRQWRRRLQSLGASLQGKKERRLFCSHERCPEFVFDWCV